MKIVCTDYDTIKKHFEEIDKNLILNPQSKYYELYFEDKPISFLSVTEKVKGKKLQANYTRVKYRGKGYFTHLLEYVINLYDEYNLYADCVEASVNIYKKCGFVCVREKQFKNFKISYMERRANSGRKTT